MSRTAGNGGMVGDRVQATMSAGQVMTGSFKQLARGLSKSLGFDIRRIARLDPTFAQIPDFDLYRPVFSPWLGEGEFRRYFRIAEPRTLVSPDRCHVLYSLLRQAMTVEGEVWECGVYKGGTAAMMAALLSGQKTLRLFDTYEGMPQTDAERDWHKTGDFADTSLESVRQFVLSNGPAEFHAGFIPDTFAGLAASRIAFAHIDLDIYQSILDSLDFIWPRLTSGGFIVFDDYGFASCAGARQAVDQFFARTPYVPLVLPTGQAVVFNGAGARETAIS
jgi:O-methyltransferase